MTQLKGNAVIAKKDAKVNGEWTNYTYELTVSSKPNKEGKVAKTNIRVVANKDMGGSIGSEVDFVAELVPFMKKDGSGSSHFFKALSMNFKDNGSNHFMDDEIPSF